MAQRVLRCLVLSALVIRSATARADDDSLFRDVVGCIEAAAGTAGIDPGMVPRAFTRDCPAACPGLAGYSKTPPGGDYWRPLASGCRLFCSDEAAAVFEASQPSHRWTHLANACGTKYYGLAPTQAALLSDVWFVVHALGDWLARANHEAGPKSRAALDDLAKTLPRVRWVLPLPASLPGRYEELPRASYGFDDVFARDYVIVGAHDLSMGAIPEAKLTLQGARLQGDWPGQVVPLASLGKRQEPFRRPVQPIAGANDRGLLGPPPSSADATINMVRASAPVVLVDANAPASRLVEVVEALGDNGARLGATDGKGAVGEHSVFLSARPIAIGAVTDHVSLQHNVPPREKIANKRGVVVWVNVQDATVRELAETMSRFYDEGVRLVVLDHADSGMTTAHGTLDKEIIRSVIRQHLDEVRRCYQQGLAQRPMYGRVFVQFVISAKGPVSSASVQDSTLGDADVERCVTDAVKTWTFPKPTGGRVVVSYPFILKMPDKK